MAFPAAVGLHPLTSGVPRRRRPCVKTMKFVSVSTAAAATLVLLLYPSTCVAASSIPSCALQPLATRSRSLLASHNMHRSASDAERKIGIIPTSMAAFWRLRGGDIAIGDDGEGETTEEESSDDFSEEEDESESEEEEGSEMEEESEDDDENENEESEESSGIVSSTPVKLIVQTGLNCPLIDQTLESTASRSRTIASVRQTVSRQMRGRPPVASIRLLLGNRVLQDDEILDDLAPDDDDEDDEEDLDDNDKDEEDDGMVKLRLTLDAVPPVDPKFGVELGEQIQKMSAAELLEAYAANAAAAHENAARLFAVDDQDDDGAMSDNNEDNNEEESTAGPALPTSTSMRRHALSVKDRIMETMPEEAIKLLSSTAETDRDEGGNLASATNSARKHRKRIAMKGGASTHVKRVIQRNLNINWPDTIRNFILFLFFGYFGGRDAFSRTIMYLGAPLCFVLQARPVKIAMKQLFYTIGEPPSMLLSLLPAPQQAIMSLNYDSAMEDLYGKEGKSLGSLEGGTDNAEDEEGDWDDSEYDDAVVDLDSDESDPYNDLYDDYDEHY